MGCLVQALCNIIESKADILEPLLKNKVQKPRRHEQGRIENRDIDDREVCKLFSAASPAGCL